MQKKVPYVAQLGNMDCSIACMTMLFRYYGLDVDIVDVGQVVHIGRDGVNLTQLKQATQQFGFKCTAYRYNKQKNILDSNLPAVVYSGSHLAVIGSKTVLGQYILLDPIKGKSIVNFEQIHDTFSDILITIRPEKRIKRKKCKPKLKVAINYKLVAGIISLMLLIQALTLSIPLVEQALIDSITQSQSLLNSAYILVGCIVIAGLYFFLSIARQKLMLRLDISFVKEIMTKMLKKLFDIDPSFFEWHAVGEIVNRFSNVQAINNIIINTFSQVAVQIITSTICLVTMFVYSPSLSVITIAIGTIEKDHTQLVKKFCANKEFKDLVSCSSGASDSHNGGKSVTIFTLDNGTRVVYKPHSLTVDRRYQECLKSIGVHTKYDMRTIEILDCGDYGWEAYVEQSPCLCIKDIEEYYYRIGVILFCNYLLKAGDIHYENLIAAGAYPMVVDAENVMDNNVAPSHISAREMIFAELGESVLYSGLLPFYKFGHNGQGVDLSALNGQEGKEYPILVPALKNIKRSDMCFEYVNPITRSHSNMAMFDGKLSDPFEHKDNICEGFSDAYNYAMQNPRDVEQLIDSFSNVKVRHLVQDTQRYSMLMHASYHPDVMQDGLSRNLLLCSMFKSYKKVQRTIAVVKEEIRDLLNMDIPYFYTKASGTSLYSSRDEEIKGYFDKSSIDKAHLRLASFNNLDRDKQCRFIKMTLTHIDKQPPAETNTHKIKENKDGDYASKNDIIRAIKFIADQLLEEAVLSEDNKDANWLGVKLVGDYGHGSLSIRPLDVYLYEGVAGICIFFAAISRYYSNYELQRVLSAATKSLFDYTEDILQREGNHIDSSGVFGGESSLVYSYSLLYQLTRNPEYLKYAEKHFPIIERAVQYDQAFDVVYGNAGAILALINLYSLKRDKRYLNCAKTAAKVICDAQQKGGGWKAATVSAPLAGFSHGVAGIVYALNKLYKLYPDKHIKQCIVNGLQYEDELFCEADGNWKDIRKGSTNGKNLCAWCHGAGGILLSRISLLGNIDNETDEIVKEDIRNAVKTMQSHKYLQNPCVCHGIAGNAEILLTYGQQFQDQIASSTAKHFYSRLVGSVNSGTFECSRPYLYGFNIPGFMTGLAGIGYSLLRLLDPTLPSVLQINI